LINQHHSTFGVLETEHATICAVVHKDASSILGEKITTRAARRGLPTRLIVLVWAVHSACQHEGLDGSVEINITLPRFDYFSEM
jgi:hypothetical protein